MKYFLSQPHQPFFVLAFVNAVISMILFLLAFKGIVSFSISNSIFHSYTLIYLVFTPAFFGFLLTVFTKFLGIASLKQSIYLKIFSIFLLSTFLSFIATFVFSWVLYISALLLMGVYCWTISIFLQIYKASKVKNKHDTYWILVALFMGAISQIFFLSSYFEPILLKISNNIAIYLYLFFMTFSVAQRMVPFFSHCQFVKNEKFMRNVFIFLLAHVLLESIWINSSFTIDFILAFIIARELKRWKLPFPNVNPLVWILHISVFWIPIAFVVSAISSLVELFGNIPTLYLGIHTLVLGFIFTILIGFGTRVTLGHSGNKLEADSLTKYLFMSTVSVVILRIFTSLALSFGYNFMIIFDISITAFVLLLLVWASRYFKVLILKKKWTKG